MNGVVTPASPPIAYGLPGSSASSLQRIVAALAVGLADRMDRREIEHIESHVADARQVADHVVEGAVAVRIVAHRAGEDLVPARESGGFAIRLDGVFDLGADSTRAAVRRGHQGGDLWGEEDLDLPRVVGLRKPTGNIRK